MTRSRALTVAAASLTILAACTGSSPKANRSPIPTASLSPSPSPSPSKTKPSIGWKTYTSSWEGATFIYPADWKASRQTLTIAQNINLGDQVTLRAPDGFFVGWIAPLFGIGGGCDASKAPHIFIDRILPMPTIGSRLRLSIILTRLLGRKSLAVVDSSAFGGSFKIGDTGQCLLYPTFSSRLHTNLGILQFSTVAVQLGNGSNSQDGSQRLSDAQFLNTPDVKAALRIFRSFRYTQSVSSDGTTIRLIGDCQTPSFEPTGIVLACADHGLLLEHLHWTRWSSTKATAVGDLVYNDCKPYCANGHYHTINDDRATVTDPVLDARGRLIWGIIGLSTWPPGYTKEPFPLS